MSMVSTHGVNRATNFSVGARPCTQEIKLSKIYGPLGPRFRWDNPQWYCLLVFFYPSIGNISTIHDITIHRKSLSYKPTETYSLGVGGPTFNPTGLYPTLSQTWHQWAELATVQVVPLIEYPFGWDQGSPKFPRFFLIVQLRNVFLGEFPLFWEKSIWKRANSLATGLQL